MRKKGLSRRTKVRGKVGQIRDGRGQNKRPQDQNDQQQEKGNPYVSRTEVVNGKKCSKGISKH